MEIFTASETNRPDINEALARFIHERVAGFPRMEKFGTLGVAIDNKIIAAVMFFNWVEEWGVMELGAAADSPKWLTKNVIKTIMGIVFDGHGCQQVYTRQAADNRRAIKIYEFLGFRKYVLPNMRGAGRDEVLFMMTADEWRAHKMNEATQ